MAQLNYRIEVFYKDAWAVQTGELGREYGLGWLDNQRSAAGPQPRYRLVHKLTGKVVDETAGSDELSCGMLPQAVGFQWPGIASAAERALRRAATDAREKRHRVALAHAADLVRDIVKAQT